MKKRLNLSIRFLFSAKEVPAANPRAMSMPAQNPVDIVNDIRSFCYGPSRYKLNQMVNMMAMVQMLQLMNQPADDEKEDSHE